MSENTGFCTKVQGIRQDHPIPHFHTAIRFDPWRMSLASFYAERMNEKMPLEYVQMDYRKGGSYEVALSTIRCNRKEELVEFGTARD